MFWCLESGSHALQPVGQEWPLEESFQHLATEADNEYAMMDRTIVRVHQHSAGAR